MQEPLDVSTLAEAVAWLSDATGQRWSDSMLLNKIVNSDHTALAVPPLDAEPTRLRFIPGEGDLVPIGKGRWGLALVSNFSVAQVWLVGESAAPTAASPAHSNGPDEYEMFHPPVRVTRENIRVQKSVLLYLRRRFEESAPTHRPTCAAAEDESDAPDNGAAPDQWSRGLKRVAWEVAWKIIRVDKQRLTGKALLAGISDRSKEVVTEQNCSLRYKGGAFNLKGGEASVSRDTVTKDWRKQLEDLLSVQ